jgi:acyl carrier protein
VFVSLQFSRKDQTMPSSSDISARVAKVLVQALGVDEEDITPSATLQGDLGAESIDFLDIIFRLEREFGIKIHQDELFNADLLRGGAEIVHDGQVTDNGLAMLRSQLPYADLRDLERHRRLSKVDDLFTVDLLLRFVGWKLAASAGPESDLHHSVFTTPVLTHQ